MLTLSVLPETLSVCRLAPDSPLPDWVSICNFYSITRTADELSIVCPQAMVPADIQSEGDWRGLKVHGPLDFSMIGVLANLSAALAEARISMFAISTFDTDYLLVKQDRLAAAIAALARAGHTIIHNN